MTKNDMMKYGVIVQAHKTKGNIIKESVTHI
jgi:hypothetical protein